MTVQLAPPLPECIHCDRPVRRTDYAAGMCPACRRKTSTADPDAGARQRLAEWTNTVARIRGDERRRADLRADRLAARRRNRGDNSRGR